MSHTALNRAKAATMLLEEALTAGLPDPFSVDLSTIGVGQISLMVTTPAEVQKWADWMLYDGAHIDVREVSTAHVCGTRYSTFATVFDIPVSVASFVPAARAAG